MLHDVRWEGRPGFLIQPPVVVKNEGSVLARENVWILVNPTQVIGVIVRGHGNGADVDQTSYRGLASGGHADHGPAVGPPDDDHRRGAGPNGVADLCRVVNQCRSGGSMGRQVRCPHVNPNVLQEPPELSPIIGIAPPAVHEP